MSPEARFTVNIGHSDTTKFFELVKRLHELEDGENIIIARASMYDEDSFVAEIRGEKIKELRKQLGLSQTEFGKEIGVSTSMISRYESGVSPMPLDKFNVMCRKFGVEISTFHDNPAEDNPTND